MKKQQQHYGMEQQYGKKPQKQQTPYGSHKPVNNAYKSTKTTRAPYRPYQKATTTSPPPTTTTPTTTTPIICIYYAFGTALYRVNNNSFVERSDGTAVGGGGFTVVDNRVLNDAGQTVGEIFGNVTDEFFVRSDGSTCTTLPDVQVDENGTVLMSGLPAANLTFMLLTGGPSDGELGAVIDENGDIRLFTAGIIYKCGLRPLA